MKPRPSLAAATLAAYQADWRHWTTWCRSRGQPTLPLDPSAVRDYVEDLAAGPSRYSAATIARRLAALSHFSLASGGDGSIARHPLVAPALTSIRRSPRSRSHATEPLTDRLLTAIVEAADLNIWPAGVSAARDILVLLLGARAGLGRAAVAGLDADGLRLASLAPGGRPAHSALSHLCLPCAAARWTALLQADDRVTRMRLVLDARTPDAQPGRQPFHACRESAESPGSGTTLIGPVVRQVDQAGAILPVPLSGWSVNRVLKHRLTAVGLDSAKYSYGSLSAAAAAGGERP